MWLPMTQHGQVVWSELMVNLRGLVYMIWDLGGIARATNLFNVLRQRYTLSLVSSCD
jgi:hypothetical protein